MTIEIVFLSFIFYSFLGWLYESTVCSLLFRHCFANCGFLLGPYCPVYGVGAVACYICLHSIQNPIVIFFSAMFLCSAIEYATGYGMEKLFHARWWDYSDFPFQLHGRICLYGALIFGAASVIVCCFLQPVVIDCLNRIEPILVQAVAVCIAALFILDLTATVGNWTALNKNLKAFREEIAVKTDNMAAEISENLLNKLLIHISVEKDGIQVETKNNKLNIRKKELRFLNAFPKINIFHYDKLISKIKEKMK